MAAIRLTDRTILTQLYPPFADAVAWLLGEIQRRRLDAYLVSGYRSLHEQRVLYSRGRSWLEQARRVKKYGRDGAVTDAWPGASPHNYGLAVDLGGRDFKKAVDLARAAGFGTVSWDPPHIEWPDWQRTFGISL
jgi:hypothetical protein